MKPRGLQQACGWCIARSFSKNVWHLNISHTDDQIILVDYLVSFAKHYHGILTPWGIEEQLYKSLIACLRNRLNPPVFLTAMLVYCPKVTIDQIAMVAERRHADVLGSGLELSQDECWGMLQVLTEYQKHQSPSMKQGKEEHTESFMLPTKFLVLEGIYFQDSNFLSHLLEKMPNLQHISLQHNGTQGVMKALSRHCKNLESLCFLEPCSEASMPEKDIFPAFFGIPVSSKFQDTRILLKKFAMDEEFRKDFVFQFPKLRRLDIDELYLYKEAIHDIYTLTLLLQPKLMCFGKHSGLTKRILTNYRKIWGIMNGRAESEATLFLSEAKFVDSVSVVPSDGSLELDYWAEVAPMFENLVSIELQKNLWSEKEAAQFCFLFSKQVRTFSLGELPLSDMSCLSNVTHLRLTLRRHYSFDKMHLILDTCPNLKTLSIHPTFYHEESRRNHGGVEHLLNLEQMMQEDMDIFDRLMFAEVMGEALDMQEIRQNHEGGAHDNNEPIHPQEDIPPPPARHEAPPGVRPAFNSSRASKRVSAKPHNLTTLRIASLCEAGQKRSEEFLRGLLERLPNLHNLCLGMWMGSLSQRRQFLTCTANALVSVVTNKELQKPLLPHLKQLCCLPTGDEMQMSHSLASLVEALPSLHTLVLPALDNYMLAPTLRYFQHTSLDIQYKCATDQVFPHWEPEH